MNPLKLEEIGDPALVERVARIVHGGFPKEETPFEKWLQRYHADKSGAFEIGLFALDALNEPDISDAARADINRYLSIMVSVGENKLRAAELSA